MQSIGGDRQPYPPGDLAMWIFILAELAVFGVFFCAYAFTRMHNAELFDQFQATLDRDAALINTIALLTSSFFVVRAVASIRDGESRSCTRWLWAAVAMGGVFLVVKSSEYAEHIGHGSFGFFKKSNQFSGIIIKDFSCLGRQRLLSQAV